MQFVKIFSTDRVGATDLTHQINTVLGSNPDARIVQTMPVQIEKIGGPEMYMMVIFEEELR